MASRTYYASQGVGLSKVPVPTSTSFSPNGDLKYLNGVQSVGMSSSVDFEQIFELGHLQIYENIEGVPTAEVTIERVMTTEPMYEILTGDVVGVNNPYEYSVAQFATDNLRTVRVGIAADQGKTLTGALNHQVVQFDGYTSNYSVNVQTDGAATESLTLQCTQVTVLPSGTHGTNYAPTGVAGGTLFRKQDCGVSITERPIGTRKYLNRVQSASLSIDVGREDLLELGRKGQYLKYATAPFEVTGEVEYIMDIVPTGSNPPSPTAASFFNSFNANSSSVCDSVYGNPSGYLFTISGIRTSPECQPGAQTSTSSFVASAILNLTSQSYSGGDTGGGNVTISESYSGFNSLLCSGVKQ